MILFRILLVKHTESVLIGLIVHADGVNDSSFNGSKNCEQKWSLNKKL